MRRSVGWSARDRARSHRRVPERDPTDLRTARHRGGAVGALAVRWPGRGGPAGDLHRRPAHEGGGERDAGQDRPNRRRNIALAMQVSWYRPVHLKRPEARKLRLLLSSREMLLRMRIDLDNHIRGVLKAFRLKVGKGASPALTPVPPDAPRPASGRRPGLPLDQRPQNRRSAAPARSRVPLQRKRPAGTRGSGDIDEPSAVTGRARSIGDHALSEIDAPGPRLTPTCGGRMRRPRTEEWPLPDDHPRSRCQLGALDPRSPITEEGSTTVPVGPPRRLGAALSPLVDQAA
jgi:hypothetical protein